MAKNSYTKLVPKPGGRFEKFCTDLSIRQAQQLPKSSNTYLGTMVETYGSEEVRDMDLVNLGNYVYYKGINHAMNLNVGRSIPWLDDGLKSVERRILFIMHKDGLYGKNSTKVASVVGSMMSNVYPHGDAAPADTIYRLGREESIMIPYIKRHGNYGGMSTLNPASPRYAAASLSAYAMDCFFSELGPKRPLYDERDNYQYNGKEPISLISLYPNTLMQWNQGIGKGAAAWLGAFNSEDIFRTAIAMLDDPAAKADIYPDLPVPMIIANKAELKGCFDRKAFKIKLRSPYFVETYKRRGAGDKLEDVYSVVFTALPIAVPGMQIVDEVVAIKTDDAKKGSTQRLPEVVNIQAVDDDSSAGGIRINVEYEHGYDPHILAEKLYRSTSLGKTVGVKYKLVTDNRPVLFTPRQILIQWINQRYDQKRRYFHQLTLQAARDRAVYEAMIAVLETKDAIDATVAIIRSSNTDAESIKRLCDRFNFTEFQARWILDIRLKTLQKMNVADIRDKRDKAIKDYKYYRTLLSDEDGSLIKETIRADLVDGMKKYAKPRMAKVKNITVDGIGNPDDKKYIIYNGSMYYCTADVSNLKTISKSIDCSYQVVEVKNSDSVLIFDKSGAMKIVNGYALSENIQGVSASTLGFSDIVSIMPNRVSDGYNTVIMVTESGYGKSMSVAELIKSVKSKVINLNAEDFLVDVIPLHKDAHENTLVGMIDGDKIYYSKAADFPQYKRSSAGNRIVKNVGNLKIGRAIVIGASDDNDHALVYGESGYMKIIDSSYLTVRTRGKNVISFQGKAIYGAVTISGSDKTLTLFGKHGSMPMRATVDTAVRLVINNEDKKIKASTTIGNPTKVLSVGKYEFYHIQ